MWYDVVPRPLLDQAAALYGEACFTDVVGNFNFANVPCLTSMFSKSLSLGIVVSSAIVKLPQILIILRSQSAEGLSPMSVLLELLSYMVTVTYNWRKGYPVLNYGETALLVVQNLAILLLIFGFGHAGPRSRSPLLATVFPVIFAGLVYVLLDSSIILNDWVDKAQAATTAVLIVSRLPQLYTNYANGSTGKLSAIAVFMYLLGSVARIFTTLQAGIHDPNILAGLFAGTVLNGLLSLQMLYYWNVPSKTGARKGAASQPQPIAAGSASSVSSSAASRSPGSGSGAARRTQKVD